MCMKHKLFLVLDIICFKKNERKLWEEATLATHFLEESCSEQKLNLVYKKELFHKLLLSALNEDLLLDYIGKESTTYCYLTQWDETANLLYEYIHEIKNIYGNDLDVTLTEREVDKQVKSISLSIDNIYKFLTRYALLPEDKLYLIKGRVRIKNISFVRLKELNIFYKNGNYKYNGISLISKDLLDLEDTTYETILKALLKRDSETRVVAYTEIIAATSCYFVELNIPYFRHASLASISMALWKNNYLAQIKSWSKEHLYLDPNNIIQENFIYHTYRGGYLYFGKQVSVSNVYEYDVNSLYPKMMKNFLPVGSTGERIIYNGLDIENIQKHFENKHLLGFIYCKLKLLHEIDIPFLQTKRPKDAGPLLLQLDLDERSNVPRFPEKGEIWYDIYTSEELFYASTLSCYEIKAISGYEFGKKSSILFRDYVNDIFCLKEAAKTPLWKGVFKSLLTTLSGKLGTRSIGINRYDKNFNGLKEHPYHKKSFLHMASFTTAYGRTFIHRQIRDLISRGYNVYYSHTDSLFLNQPLPQRMLSEKRRTRLSRLGKFRLITKIPNRAVFLGPNNYIIQSLNEHGMPDGIVRAVGGYHNTWEEFVQALYGLDDNQST